MNDEDSSSCQIGRQGSFLSIARNANRANEPTPSTEEQLVQQTTEVATGVKGKLCRSLVEIASGSAILGLVWMNDTEECERMVEWLALFSCVLIFEAFLRALILLLAIKFKENKKRIE